MNRKPLLLIPLWLSVALLCACSDDMDELRKYCADVRARKNNHIEPIPQIKQYETFTYVAGGRRDPFAPSLNVAKNGNSVSPDRNRNKEPLEEFPLDALKMVGIIDYEKVLYALVKAPDGVIHRVTVGNHMGQNFGRIIKIDANQISLIEIVADGFGGFKEQPASLAE